MSIPAIYNFPDHYQNNGLSVPPMTLTYADGTPLDLTGAVVRMQLKDGSRLGFEFSSEDGSLSILPAGVVKFNKIDRWSLPPAKYSYDLEITDNTGFVRTYVRGTWNVLPKTTR